MGTWLYSANIKKFIAPNMALDVCKHGVASELKKVLPFTTRLGAAIVQQIEQSTTVEEFDNALEQAYNYADGARVWLGP